MNASKAILEMLRGYETEYIFGLPGETTLPLYAEWKDYSDIKHIMARDERSSAFMADGYARFSFKPGICEAPSVGSTHVLPGVAEAYKAGVPMIVLTSDIPLHYEKRNMLTGLDQTSMFMGMTKETITLTDPNQVPYTIRRAFRLSTTGKPGPVHIRLPMDVLNERITNPLMYIQEDFKKYPGHRTVASEEKIIAALKLLGAAERPFLVCGQGSLFSQAWDEVITLSETYLCPVGTTINGKGVMPEIHPLSVGVIGARGGTEISNGALVDSDLIFFIGSNTDSAGTDKWTVPPEDIDAKIIQLDISEAEAGNNYNVDVFLIGDAKATLRRMLKLAEENPKEMNKQPRIKKIQDERKKYLEYVNDLYQINGEPVHPLRLIKSLEEAMPENRCMVMDVGTVAIYTSTFYRVPEAGRSMAYNFSMGSLGYAIPTGIGESIARPKSCTVSLIGDGSFGLTSGELETVSRLGLNNNLVLINNNSFGWIRAEWRLSYGDDYVDFATNFKEVNYLKIAEGFGLKANKVSRSSDLKEVLVNSFNDPEPSFTEVVMQPEDKLIPPVPKWIKLAREKDIDYIG
jgi:acetolactate synthase-1/2/3 large subunit